MICLLWNNNKLFCLGMFVFRASLNFYVMFRNNPKPFVFSTARRRDNELETRPHLAYTLAEAAECYAQGKPITQANMASFSSDGPTVDDDALSLSNLPLDVQRGKDINDAWNAKLDQEQLYKRYGLKSVEQANLK